MGFILAFRYVIIRIILLLYLLKAEFKRGRQGKFVDKQRVVSEKWLKIFFRALIDITLNYIKLKKINLLKMNF